MHLNAAHIAILVALFTVLAVITVAMEIRTTKRFNRHVAKHAAPDQKK